LEERHRVITARWNTNRRKGRIESYSQGSRMIRDNPSSSSIKCSRAPGYENLEYELRESLEKVEHRAEVLLTISRDQRRSGHYGLAESYRRQGINLKGQAESIRRILIGMTPITAKEGPKCR
jgi:hypothetical protein